jgi:hypothetical protein
MRTWKEIAAFAKHHGFWLIVNQSETGMELGTIVRPMDQPKGMGAVIVQALCELADDTSRPIKLDVASNEPKLILYYEQFGFRLTGTHNLGIVQMRRAPNQA